MNKNEITPVQIAIRIVIIIVVIVILLLVSFAMVRFVPKVISSLGNFRNIFGISKEELEISLDKKEIADGEETTLTYEQKGGKAEGYYVLSYSCGHIDSDTTSLEVRQGDEGEALLCDDPITIGQAATGTLSGEVILTPSIESSKDQVLDITVSHVIDSATVSKDSVILTVAGNENREDDNNENGDDSGDHSGDQASAPTLNRPTPSRPTPTYSTTPARLNVRMGAVNVDRNGKASVTFYVTNTGGRSSGSWRYSATLPRSVGQTSVTSTYQPSIPAGGTSTMFITFGNAEAGTINVYVKGDQASAVLR
jgi:hypothetical protein